ncbi:MAG: hypothetical protein WCQ21_14985, partial [Verrucomicrobiota bacterium]
MKTIGQEWRQDYAHSRTDSFTPQWPIGDSVDAPGVSWWCFQVLIFISYCQDRGIADTEQPLSPSEGAREKPPQ